MRFKLRYVGFAAVLSLIGFVSQAAAATDLSVTEASGNPGQEVSVNLLLNTDAGISGLGLSVLYDATKLSVVTAVATDFGDSFSAIVNPALENEIRVTAARFPAPDPGSGSIVDITFLIAENAPEGDITLELQVGELLDANEEAIEFTAANGKITVANRPPTVTALDPASGVEAGGQLVTIIGVDFVEGATVTFGETASPTVTLVDATLTAVSPPGTAGAVDVVVTNPDGKSSGPQTFTYLTSPPAVTGIDPASGFATGGQLVTITGAGFAEGATVTFGETASPTVTLVDATSLTAVSPPGTGEVNVVVTNPDGQPSGPQTFTYVPVIEPALTATSETDFSIAYSPLSSGNNLDGSEGEVTFSVSFTDNTEEPGSGQPILWEITNAGSETVYLVAPVELEIGASTTEEVTAATGSDGLGSVTFDSGVSSRAAGTTSILVMASTTADDSNGMSRTLEVSFSATWDVPVVAELASITAEYTLEREAFLQWTVASQTNNLGWEVYRSVDLIGFDQVGDLVPGDGTVDGFRMYSFVDKDLPPVDVVYYYLKQLDLDGKSARSDVIELKLSAVRRPTAHALWQNFPNPFNPETIISFDLAEEAPVTLTIFDLKGQVVRILAQSQPMRVGHHQLIWDALDESGIKVGSGVYFYQLRVNNFTSEKKMTLLQ